MLKGTVTRSDKAWQGHPDVAYFKNKFYVVYRESKHHKSFKNTKINIVSSVDGSMYSKPTTLLVSYKSRWNCPRLSVIDNALWLVCDCIENTTEGFVKSENDPKAISIWVMSTKDGVEWSKPFKTNINGIVPDRMFMSNNHFFVASHRYHKNKSKYATGSDGKLIQNIWRTKNPRTPWDMVNIAKSTTLNLCEGSVCKLNNGDFVCLMRENSGNGLPAYLSRSTDSGLSWTDIRSTRLFGCHRPVVGQLKSGNCLVTYREQSFSLSANYWAKNTFACLIKSKSLSSEPYCSCGVILPLDHDNNKKSDSGYTGWVQLPNDNIYIVNYVTADASKPYIKWYLISEDEF